MTMEQTMTSARGLGVRRAGAGQAIRHILHCAALTLPALATAQGLPEAFPFGAKAPAFDRGTMLASPYTVGGYPAYLGEGRWAVLAARETTNNLQVRHGHLWLGLMDGGQYAAEMYLMVSLNRAGQEGTYYTNDFCAIRDDQLVRVSRARGQQDDCLLIRPASATYRGQPVNVIEVSVHITKSGDRLYRKVLRVNPALAGFATQTAWSRAAVDADPAKSAYLRHLEAWGRALHAAADAATDWGKPADAYAKVAPIATVLRPAASAIMTPSPAPAPTPSAATAAAETASTPVASGTTAPAAPSASASAPAAPPSAAPAAERLRRLRELRDQGLISKEVYEQRQREILETL
jgi:hypothetical protein